MIESNFFYQRAVGFESFISDRKLNTQNTIKNCTIISGYIPVISIVTGISRIVFAAQILYYSNDENLRKLAVLHIFRGTAEILCIGLVCIVADLYFSSCNQENIVDNRGCPHQNPNQEPIKTKDSDSKHEKLEDIKKERSNEKSKGSKDDDHDNRQRESSPSFSELDTASSSDTTSPDPDDQNDPVPTSPKKEDLIKSPVNNVICKQDETLSAIKKFMQKEISFGFSHYEKTLKEFSESEQADINTHILNLIESNIHLKFKSACNMFFFANVAKKIVKLPQSDRAELMKYVLDILDQEIDFTVFCDSYDLEGLIELFAKTLSKDRLDFSKILKSYIKMNQLKKILGNNYQNLMLKISQRPAEKEVIISCIKTFIINESTNSKREFRLCDLVDLIVKLDFNRLIFEQAIKLYEILSNNDLLKLKYGDPIDRSKIDFGSFLKWYILTIKDLDENILIYITEVIESILEIKTSSINWKEIEKMITFFGETKPEKRAYLKQLLINVYENKLQSTDKYILDNFLNNISKLPLIELDQFLKSIFKLFAFLKISPSSVRGIFEASSNITAIDMPDIVENTEKFIQIAQLDKMQLEICAFIKSIKLVSINDRSYILEYISKFLSDCKQNKSHLNLLGFIPAIVQIPQNERQAKYDQAWEFIKTIKNKCNYKDSKFTDTLNSLAKVEQNEWTNVVSITNRLIDDISTKSFRISDDTALAAFIELMQPLQNVEREKVYDLSFDLYYLVLKTYKHDFEDKDYFCKNYEGNIAFVIRIMCSLQDLKPADRADIFEISKENINNIRACLVKFIEQMKKIDLSDRREIYNQAIGLCSCTENLHPYYLNEAVGFFANYDSENRKRIIDYIDKLLVKFGHKIDIETITETIKSLSTYIPILTNYNYKDDDNSSFIMKFIESDASKYLGTLPFLSLPTYCEALDRNLKKIVEDKNEVFEYSIDLIALMLKHGIQSCNIGIFDCIEVISKVQKSERKEFYELSMTLIQACEKDVNVSSINDIMEDLSGISKSQRAILIKLFVYLNAKNKLLTKKELRILKKILDWEDEYIKVGIAFFQWHIEKSMCPDHLTKHFQTPAMMTFKQPLLFKQFRKEYQMKIILELLCGINDNNSTFVKDGFNNKDIISLLFHQLNTIFEETYSDATLKSLLSSK